MNLLGIGALLSAIVDLVSKVMDGKKTKAGLGVVAVGAAIPALSFFGVDVTPDAVVSAVNQVLALFGYHVVGDAAQVAQTFLGSLVSLIGSVIALYGYAKKGQLISK